MRVSRVNRAVRLPRLRYGVSARAMGYVWGPAAFIAVMVGSDAGWLYACVPMGVGFLTHAIVRWAYRKDHRVFEIYGKYARFADHYHPHSRETLPPGFERPHKVGRGLRT